MCMNETRGSDLSYDTRTLRDDKLDAVTGGSRGSAGRGSWLEAIAKAMGEAFEKAHS
jgi:hypothetical protein